MYIYTHMHTHTHTHTHRLPGGTVVKNPPAIQETYVRFLGGEYPLEKGMATHSSILGLGNLMDRGAWEAMGPRGCKT